MSKLKYGVIVGRFQPFHKGHQHIIDKIIADGLRPVIVLGSAQEMYTDKNPFTPLERMFMISLLYNTNTIAVDILALDDSEDWDDWYDRLVLGIMKDVTPNLDEVTIYLHDKLEDLQNFTFRGTDYTDSSYSEMFKVDGMHTTQLKISDIDVRAKQIRENFTKCTSYLDPKHHEYICSIRGYDEINHKFSR